MCILMLPLKYNLIAIACIPSSFTYSKSCSNHTCHIIITFICNFLHRQLVPTFDLCITWVARQNIHNFIVYDISSTTYICAAHFSSSVSLKCSLPYTNIFSYILGYMTFYVCIWCETFDQFTTFLMYVDGMKSFLLTVKDRVVENHAAITEWILF